MFGYEGVGSVILRMAAIFAVALVVVRIMGNRAVGQLSPFDFVLMVGIGDIVANVAMEDAQALLVGAEGLIGLLVLQQLLSYLALKSKTLRKWFEGAPVTLIENGKILPKNFVKTQLNYDDLRQELHKMGMDITNIKDIKVARLESSGDFSIILKHEAEPITRRDFETFLQNMHDNPLSPVGQHWAKMEQMMDDIHVLAESVRQQQKADANEFIETNQMQTKEVH